MLAKGIDPGAAKQAEKQARRTLSEQSFEKMADAFLDKGRQEGRAKISAVFRFAVASGAAEFDPAQPLRDALIRPKPKSRAAITDKAALGALLRAIDGFERQVAMRIA